METLKRFCVAAVVLAAIYCELVQRAAAQEGSSNNVTYVRFTAEDGERHLINKIEPVYPHMGNREGKVSLLATVSPTGTVEKVVLVGGALPDLLKAAIDAVKQWQYAPFVVSGRPVGALVPVEIIFASKFDWGAYHAYERQVYKCGANLKQRHYRDAEESCGTMVDMAEKMSPEDPKELAHAYGAMGDVFWFQNKFPEAQGYYLKEMATAEKINELFCCVGDFAHVGLAHAYFDAARGYQGLDDFKQAGFYYQLADRTLEGEYDRMNARHMNLMPDETTDSARYRAALETRRRFKNQLVEGRQWVLQAYAGMLRQSGDASEADAAEQKAKDLSEKMDSEKIDSKEQ